ncbi:MarR family EPS-associated transcriptional regulator [Castellaniella sp. S9]|uniref:MarR family EPS-associated transcriptional regulator n=1 Tax=Castellaniella sp. S9 TaxID=2993652 RepID=UPI0022B56046|nr:MarR family EPS-associated transcriptional regulator [Castellaniella sp. S9]
MTPEQQARFRVLKTLEEHPDYSQRELAAAIGLSLGRTNYVLRALMEKGLVKIGKFLRSDQKLVKTAYLLTPEGVKERMRLTQGYIERKQTEYELLKSELEALRAEIPNASQQPRR